VFITTKWFDQIIAAAITGVISFLGSLLSYILGFYILFIAMGAGLLAVWAVKKAISNRRSPRLKIVMSVSAFVASLPPIVTWIIASLPAIREYGFLYSGGLLSIVWSLAYSVIISSNIYYQLRK
jgi:hypothetical protein